jgi:carbon monoxide dehydrogenase subunit G
MARIEKSVEIDRSADDVWKVVGDFGGISTWLPAIASSSFSDGVRECSMEGGGVLREEITGRDDDAHRFDYSITEAPFPIESHHASMSVEATDTGSRVTWVTEIRPDDLAAAMEPVFAEGIHALKAHLEQA